MIFFDKNLKSIREDRTASTMAKSCTLLRGTEEEIQVSQLLLVPLIMVKKMMMMMMMMIRSVASPPPSSDNSSLLLPPCSLQACPCFSSGGWPGTNSNLC